MDLFIWQNNQCGCFLRGPVLISTQYLSFLINFPPSQDRGNRGEGRKEKNKMKQTNKKLLERTVLNKVRGKKIKRNTRGTDFLGERIRQIESSSRALLICEHGWVSQTTRGMKLLLSLLLAEFRNKQGANKLKLNSLNRWGLTWLEE